jgi:hypothetical protein
MQQVSSRDGQEMLLDLEETGPQQPHLQCGTSCIEAYAVALQRSGTLRFVGQRMVLFFGQIFRSDRTLT